MHKAIRTKGNNCSSMSRRNNQELALPRPSIVKMRGMDSRNAAPKGLFELNDLACTTNYQHGYPSQRDTYLRIEIAKFPRLSLCEPRCDVHNVLAGVGPWKTQSGNLPTGNGGQSVEEGKLRERNLSIVRKMLQNIVKTLQTAGASPCARDESPT